MSAHHQEKHEIAKKIIHHSQHLIHISCEFINLFGALILVSGALLAIVNLVIIFLNSFLGTQFRMVLINKQGSASELSGGTANFEKLRKELGDITALGLEVLVVSDVLETLAKDADEFSYESLGKIAALATFRTLLAYFLSREVNEVLELLEKGRKEDSIKEQPKGRGRSPAKEE